VSHPEDLTADMVELKRLLAGEVSGYRLEKRYLRADGTPVWGLLSVGLVRAADGNPRHLVAAVLDITDRKAEEEQLRGLVDRDPLTGLFNRRRFRQEVELRRAKAQRYGSNATVLLLDIDDFKSVNDAYGHHVGDRVLLRVADILRRQTRQTDIVARLGGDEFAVLLTTGPDEAGTVGRAVIDRLRAALRVRSRDDFAGPPIEASIGVACLDAAEADADGPLIIADEAMYRDKRRRRGQG
jgi:diguanylate cyclase (GGDEF)-like protein